VSLGRSRLILHWIDKIPKKNIFRSIFQKVHKRIHQLVGDVAYISRIFFCCSGWYHGYSSIAVAYCSGWP